MIRYHQKELANFYVALRKSDQAAFQDLFALAQFHIAPLAFSGAAEPDRLIYFAMILEQHKLILRLQETINHLVGSGDANPGLDS